MRNSSKSVILMALMLMSCAVAFAIRPMVKYADHNSPIQLEEIIPETFGDWKEVKANNLQIINPQQQEIIDELYSQTLSKTYVNSAGYRIMLSIAYGGDQTRDLQVHRPEVCYAAQGFSVSGAQKLSLQVAGGEIPAMRLEAQLGNRKEPITYWIRIGDKLARGNIEQGLARLSYGMQGFIADGLLFRVSSIDGDSPNAYLQQEKFVAALLAAMSDQNKPALLGNFAGIAFSSLAT
jgi:EpsI family protein